MRIIRSDKLKTELLNNISSNDFPDVSQIIKKIKKQGDEALIELTELYDGVKIKYLKVDSRLVEKAFKDERPDLIDALMHIKENLESFSKAQRTQFKDFVLEVENGVHCGQVVVPVERVGIYVPGGAYPLVSSLLMAAVPAKIAGVKKIIICTPPKQTGDVHPSILAAAHICGINEIYRVGGAQAIAAMAYGTETVPKVDMIVGPGNRYVTAAKKQVYGDVGIDFIAGPTELLIVADAQANPAYIAADLLAQAEHDPYAQPILITTSDELACSVKTEIERQIKSLNTKQIASRSIKNNGLIIIVKTIKEAADIVNTRAPEHLELQLQNYKDYLDKFRNYGSLFLGENSPEALGDYSSGLNHILPTAGAARYTGGLSVNNFLKLQTTLRVTTEGLKNIAPHAELIADEEKLNGHKKSLSVRTGKI